MKKMYSRKIISVFVMFAFVSVFCFPAYSAQVKINRTENQEKNGDKTFSQETKSKTGSEGEAEIAEYYSRDDANVIEDEGYPGQKKRKFPWLLVVGGVVVVGVVLYFLVIKKPKYDLAVSLGEGVSGNPPSGTTTYKKGEVVSYNYSLQSGYTDLQVKVDGVTAPAGGSITMDKNKTLSATATKVATLIVNSNPTGAQIILDGSDSGELTNHTFTFASGGNHNVVLRKLGYIEYSTSKSVAVGDTGTINKTLTKGLREYFNSGAGSSILWKWISHPSGNWSVSGGTYTGNADVDEWNYSGYAYNWGTTKYTVTVKMKRSSGNRYNSNSVVIGSGSGDASVNGYLFNYTTDGWISIWKLIGVNMRTNAGSATAIKGWSANSKVNTGLGTYNTLKIVRDGSNYSYYLNDQHIYSFTDTTYNPAYMIIGGYCGGDMTKLDFDYVYVDIGNTAGSIPGPAVSVTQGFTSEKPGYHK